MRRIAKLLLGIAAAIVLVVGYFDARRVLRETQTASQVAPRRGSIVHAGDADLFIQTAGDVNAPAVVLVHGTGTWSEIWRETIDALAPRYRVIAVDLPPFGYSSKLRGASAYTPQRQAARILNVLDALHVERATIVGHSVGARPVVALALMVPSRVERLVLVDAAALGVEPSETSPLVSRFFAAKPLRDAVLSTYGTNPLFLRRLFQSFVSKKEAVTDARVAIIEQPMSIDGTTGAYGDWMQWLMVSSDMRLGALHELRMPVSLLWGDDDRVTPLWQGLVLEKTIPRSRLTVLHGVGHIPYIEDAPRFNEALLRALAQPAL